MNLATVVSRAPDVRSAGVRRRARAMTHGRVAAEPPGDIRGIGTDRTDRPAKQRISR